MKLIPEARRAWRMFSVQAQALALALIGSWQAMPQALQDKIPPSAVLAVAMVLLVAGIVGRLIHQPKVQEPPK